MFSSMKKQQRSTVCGAVSIRFLIICSDSQCTSSKYFVFRFPQEKCRSCFSLSPLIVSNKISMKLEIFVGWGACCDWLDPFPCICFSVWQVLGIDIAQGCKGIYRCFCLFFYLSCFKFLDIVVIQFAFSHRTRKAVCTGTETHITTARGANVPIEPDYSHGGAKSGVWSRASPQSIAWYSIYTTQSRPLRTAIWNSNNRRNKNGHDDPLQQHAPRPAN